VITSSDLQQDFYYLALGDSYTIGESVNPSQRYPTRIYDTLINLGYKSLNPRIIAKTGWTTDELQAAISGSDLRETYDLVSLLIGVNNQYRGWSISQFEKEFEELLEFAITKAGGDRSKVFVISIPDWGVMPFAEGRDREKIAEEIDAYNAVKKSITEQKSVTFINITDISRQRDSEKVLIAEDGLHPSGEQYRRWVERIFPVIKKQLDE